MGSTRFRPFAVCHRCVACGHPADDEIRYAILEVFPRVELVGLTGLEPVTLRLSSACSNQLSYRPEIRVELYWTAGAICRAPLLPSAGVETRGFEPLTYSLQSYRSTN